LKFAIRNFKPHLNTCTSARFRTGHLSRAAQREAGSTIDLLFIYPFHAPTLAQISERDYVTLHGLHDLNGNKN
jgi:hypothetical protein